jgi:signal transduction histidine kinase
VTAARSFRGRLLLGSVLGALGLVAIAHLLSMMVFPRYPVVFRIPHGTVLAVALILIAAGLAQVRRGLTPFKGLRERLAAVREGRDRRIEGHYPSEVQPMVNDLNALLDHREQVVTRALAKAGDLAHGLKTPLAVLSQEAERAAAEGHRDLAAHISKQVERMRRHVDYHLAHARAAASGATPGARCSVAASADGLARTLLRLHAGRGLAIHVDVPPEHFVRGERADLDEMLGNLLDNACKWARSQVTLASSAEEAGIVITVDDDGPGLDPSMREEVLLRGVRADEASPGSGLGLGIVRDLAELYGGSISLGSAAIGGLRARLRLPACPCQDGVSV